MIDPLSLAAAIEAAEDVVVVSKADAAQLLRDIEIGRLARETLADLRSSLATIAPDALAR